MRSNRVVLRLAVVIFMGLLAVISAHSQTATGRILGNITDQSGAAVKGATVTVDGRVREELRALSPPTTQAHTSQPISLPALIR